jgi:hypothetical protein
MIQSNHELDSIIQLANELSESEGKMRDGLEKVLTCAETLGLTKPTLVQKLDISIVSNRKVKPSEVDMDFWNRWLLEIYKK